MNAPSVHQYAMRDPLLFGDYRNMINTAEPRYYEDLLDYEAIYFLFQEVHVSGFRFCLRHAVLHFVFLSANLESAWQAAPRLPGF